LEALSRLPLHLLRFSITRFECLQTGIKLCYLQKYPTLLILSIGIAMLNERFGQGGV
jgi:hypothetical protein